MTDQEELELLQLEKEKYISSQSQNTPKLTGDPRIDMADANKEVAQKTSDSSWPSILDKANQSLDLGKLMNNTVLPMVAGGAVGGTILKAGTLAPNLLRTVLAGAGGGATTGALSPANSIGQRVQNTAIDAGIGGLASGTLYGAGKAIDYAKKIPSAFEQIKNNINNIKDPAAFSANVRESLFNAKKAVGDTFGSEIDALANANPTRTVDHSADFARLNAALNDADNPGLGAEVKAIIRRVKDPEISKMINGFIEHPDTATNIPLADSQALKVAIQNSPSIATKLGAGKFASYSPGDLEVLDLLDNVKNSQASVFPELADIRKPYADYMKNYNVVKNDFKPKQLLNKIRSGFGNEEVQKIINAVIPNKTINDITGFRNAEKVIKGAKIAGEVAAGAAGTAIVGKKVWDLTH